MASIFQINLMKEFSIVIGKLTYVSWIFIDWLGNSLHFDAFNDFVERKLAIRQDKLLKSNSLSIKVSPELAHLFTNSQMISSIFVSFLIVSVAQKGRSTLLLNRERKFQRLAKVEEDKTEKEEMNYQLKKQVEELKDELNSTEFDRFKIGMNRDILGRLYDENLIYKDGKPVNNENH